jgi:hypothetical protein
MSPKRVGFLIYPAMQALDLVRPMDAFSAVMLADGKGRRRPGYEVLTIGFDAKPVGPWPGSRNRMLTMNTPCRCAMAPSLWSTPAC